MRSPSKNPHLVAEVVAMVEAMAAAWGATKWVLAEAVAVVRLTVEPPPNVSGRRRHA